MKRTLVISAVNIRKGGTLTILRGCLAYLSSLASEGNYRVVALVHRRSLADYPGIEYLEFPDTIQHWGKRLWCEYVTMHRISKQLAPVYLWFSLHDTTPRVKAERRVVYCQTSFPFLTWKLQDLRFDYKIVLFALLTRFAYRVNIRCNRYLVVQAEWLRQGFSRMFGLPPERFIVAPPERPFVPMKEMQQTSAQKLDKVFTFLFAATPDCHKNFEVVCRAAQQLEQLVGKNKFRVIFTIKGHENKYTQWLYRKWGTVESIEFRGFLKKDELYACYDDADCLLFPSRIETWGLPISEFSSFRKPMILADLPYAHEAASGSSLVSFFNPAEVSELKEKMLHIMQGHTDLWKSVNQPCIHSPIATSWKELFDLLTR